MRWKPLAALGYGYACGVVTGVYLPLFWFWLWGIHS